MSTSFLSLTRGFGGSRFRSFLEGVRAAFDLSGSIGVLSERPSSDLEAMGRDWRAIGSDLRVAINDVDAEVQRAQENQLELAL